MQQHGSGAVVSVEDQLRQMREGYSTKLELKMGGWSIPVRLLTAMEERIAVAEAKKRATKTLPSGVEPDLFESLEVMKAVLEAAGTVDHTPRLSRKLLDALSNTEIEKLYNDYMTLTRTANPEFESLSVDTVVEMIEAVKKKERLPSDFFTWQLAEIGKFFLVRIQVEASVRGSS